MRSRLCFYIRAFRGACECTWKYRSISTNSPVQQEIKDTINEVKYGCLWFLAEGFIEVMNGLGVTLEEGEICMCLRAALLCEQFCQARMEVPSYLSSPTSWDRLFCLSVFSSSEVLGKITTIRSKLPTEALLVSGRQERKLWSQPALACFRYHRHHSQIVYGFLRPLRRYIWTWTQNLSPLS